MLDLVRDIRTRLRSAFSPWEVAALVAIGLLGFLLWQHLDALTTVRDPPGTSPKVRWAAAGSGGQVRPGLLSPFLHGATISVAGCGEPVRVSFRIDEDPAHETGRAARNLLFAGEDVRPGSIRLGLGRGYGIEERPRAASDASIREALPSAETAAFTIPEIVFWDLHFEADWTRPRGAGSCYLSLPQVRLDPGELSTNAYVSTFTSPSKWFSGVEASTLVLDLGASGNPPEAASDLSWRCTEELPDRPGNDACSGWIVLNEAGVGSVPSRTLLYGTIFGVVLAIGVELLLRGLTRGGRTGTD